MAYNRYASFMIDNEIKNVPFIKLPSKTSDKIEIYELGVTRLDIISEKYYKNPNYGWLIQLANPSLGSLEFNIPNHTEYVVPYPLETTLKDLQNETLKYIKYYGI